MPEILIADDEARMRRLIADFLKKENYKTVEVPDGQQAVDAVKSDSNISIVLMDVMMPVMDGWKACREIRKFSDVPVIMLTAKDTESDELKGYTIGADDYIAKPFSMKVLTARINAILSRVNGAKDEIIEYNGICLNKTRHEITIDGIPKEFSLKEFELLEYFMKNKGIALSREKILSNVWNYDYFGDDRTIDTHVKKLRKKLGDKGRYIRTIWGMGYKFSPDEGEKT